MAQRLQITIRHTLQMMRWTLHTRVYGKNTLRMGVGTKMALFYESLLLLE